MTEINSVTCGDCLEIMPSIPDKSIDMINCDLPYETTACSWDTIIPFEPLWKQYKRIIKDNGAIVLSASQPFTSKLVMSNLDWFKYEWIWEKDKPSNFALANKRTMLYHENILIFYKNQPIFNKQLEERSLSGQQRSKYKQDQRNRKSEHLSLTNGIKFYSSEFKNPSSIQKFITAWRNTVLHPTQKPVALYEYLIKTYTNEGDTVLDNCAGSCTTAIACINLRRNYICIEKEEKYCEIGRQRIKEATRQMRIF